MDPSQADERRSIRSAVLLTAVLECDGTDVPVRVVNLSANGALVSADELPPADGRVLFRCKSLVVEGWVAWSHPPNAGINFDTDIDPKEVVPKNRTEEILVTGDERQTDFRRPGLRGTPLTPAERKIVEDWRREEQSRGHNSDPRRGKTQ